MSLYQDLGDHLKAAMKSGDTGKRDTLRLFQSAVKNSAIEKRKQPAELTDAEVQDVIRRLVKQRKDSIAQYQAGNRPDLAEKEAAELHILEAYRPAELADEKLREIVIETLSEAGLTAREEMGQAMGLVMKKIAGQASGERVRKMVEAALAGE